MFDILNWIQDRTGKARTLRSDATGRVGMNYHFRDVTSTANAALTRAQETTILAAPAATWLDVVQITASNSSTNAVSVSIRAQTAGGVAETITIPAGNSIALDYLIPLMQDEQAATWTGQNVNTGEISDSPVTISLRAIQNT